MRQAWLNGIIRYPWITILVVVAIAVAASYGGKNLYFRGDYKVFFDKDFPQLGPKKTTSWLKILF